MDINVEKLIYYLGGVGFLLLVCVVYYFIRGKKMVEEELKKQLEEREEARIEGEGGNGLYTLCPTNPVGPDGTAPDIVISDDAGEIQSKIHTVPPRVIYTNCPKTEEDWVNVRRDAVIQMIIAEGGEPFH